MQHLGEFADEQLAEYIVMEVGSDMFRLASECDKLVTYMHYQKISKLTREIIDEVIYCEIDANNFAVLDTLVTDTEKTL